MALANKAAPDISGKAALMHLYSMKDARPSFTALKDAVAITPFMKLHAFAAMLWVKLLR